MGRVSGPGSALIGRVLLFIHIVSIYISLSRLRGIARQEQDIGRGKKKSRATLATSWITICLNHSDGMPTVDDGDSDAREGDGEAEDDGGGNSQCGFGG